MSRGTVFLSVPLIGLLKNDLSDELPEAGSYRELYRRIMEICVQHDLEVYDPYEHTDPKKHDYIRPNEIYLKNRDIISSAIDLLIAYVGIVSGGVSIEIEMANHYSVPAIIMYEDDKYNQVSRMILGCSNTQNRIVAPNTKGLADKLDEKLDSILHTLKEEKIAQSYPGRARLLEILNRIHDGSGLSINQVARLASIDKGYVSRLLAGKIGKPSRDQLIRLCGWGWKIGSQETNDILKAAGYQTLW